MRDFRTAAVLACAAVFMSTWRPAAAQGIDLRDRIISITVRWKGEKPGESGTKEIKYQAVAGRVISPGVGGSSDCQLSLVYTPGQASSGNPECKPKRIGTSDNWDEWGRAATFRAESTVAGNVLMLRGEFETLDKGREYYCGKDRQFTWKGVMREVVRLRIVGSSCQVLEYRRAEQWESTMVGDGGYEARGRTTYAAASCTINRRSDEPPPKPRKRSFMQCY
jgi:hypothetical protein